LISEVIPLIEEKYLKEPSSERYLAGLSAGAGHTRYIGFRNPAVLRQKQIRPEALLHQSLSERDE
jgi:hypothetical protein